VKIGDITVTLRAGNLYWVDMEVKNEKTYPTSSDCANLLGIARPDKIMIRTVGNVGLVEIPTGKPRSTPPTTAGPPPPWAPGPMRFA